MSETALVNVTTETVGEGIEVALTTTVLSQDGETLSDVAVFELSLTPSLALVARSLDGTVSDFEIPSGSLLPFLSALQMLIRKAAEAVGVAVPVLGGENA